MHQYDIKATRAKHSLDNQATDGVSDSAVASYSHDEASGKPMDRAQIAELIKLQYGGLLSLVRRKLKDRELAADLVNEAIAITLEHAQLGRLTQPDRLGGYAFKVSMNLLRNHQRNSDNRGDLRSHVDTLELLPSHDNDDIEAAQLKRRAHQVIESLASPRDREVIKRFYLDEEDKQVICDVLGLTPLQFTQVISRARHRMKLAFESEGLKRSDFFSVLF